MAQERKRPIRLPNRPRGEDRSLEALRARQLSEDPGYETPGRVGEPTDGVLVQVCIACGKECMFDDKEPPSELTCPKCGNQVFRSFFAARRYDEVDTDFRASTERDLETNEPETDVTKSDILDLNNL